METFLNRQVVVLGLAKSGVAVAKLLHRFGAHVTVNDKKPREQATGVEELEALGIRVITGGHPDDLIHDGIALVVKNPGIPYETPPIQQAQRLGIPVVTEVEVASWLLRAPVIGITGSNGKTTTTTLVGLIMQEAGLAPIVAGNIGTPLCEIAESAEENQWIVAELSSFQLMGTKTFRPRIGALLNIYPAHLDYHHTMDEYVSAKARLFANQTQDDYAILPFDQPTTREKVEPVNGRAYYFSRTSDVPRGVCVREGKIVFVDGEREEIVMERSELSLPGEHNLENALAAILISKLAGADAASMRKVLTTFHGVEHRLERVVDIGGVRYYNDSKATNPQAATKSIETFSEPIVLIAGGLDRGIDFKELVPVLGRNVKALVAYGQTASILLERAEEAGISLKAHADTVEKAVEIAAQYASPGDVVLLSPACASWDMFPSFEVRGSIFKDAVHRLKQA
ncbi:UDP-N-acetylmuramoyl-L-alanine--D-glutamate ligase [Brevibacillus fluminis]|uniref:UDP-N-acetylmuramoyl-L-alanine--D-glutamate ligase n=1 Tax=Brevibacillus fluminis TaxID=511487 RepID=UPI003F8B155D